MSDAEARAPFRRPWRTPVPPALASLAFALAVAAVVLLAVALRLPGLDPRSLYIDDTWVGVLVKEAPLSEILALRPHHPIGFLGLLSLVRRAVADPELSVQALPFAASLCLIPLVAWLVRRQTGGAAAGILAAVLVALNPELSAFSIRGKPFETDALVCLVLVALGLDTLLRPSFRRLAWLALLAAVVTPFSYPAGLVGSVVVALAFLRTLGEKRDRVPAAALFALFLAVMAALASVAFSGRGNDTLQSYWASGFMPVGSARGAFDFAASRSRRILESAFPPGWGAMGLLVPLGVAALALRKSTRPGALLAAALWASLLAAAALRLYPLSSRTAVFAYAPIVAFAAGIVGRYSARLPRPSGEALPGLLAASLVLTASTPLADSRFDDARVVEALERAARPGVGVLIYPNANWSVAYYAGWPMRLAPVDYYGTRFEARPLRARTTLLPGRTGYEVHPEFLDAALGSFFSRSPDEILYIATHLEDDCCAAHARVVDAFRAAGYTGRRLAQAHGAELLRFRREPGRVSRPGP